MNRNELEAAIKVAEHELMKLTHETLRPNQGFKMRTHGPIISSIITAIEFYRRELSKLPKENRGGKE